MNIQEKYFLKICEVIPLKNVEIKEVLFYTTWMFPNILKNEFEKLIKWYEK